MRSFGHMRPERKGTGKVLSPVQFITREALGGGFGGDGKRRLIFSAEAGDVLSMRPAGTSRRVSMPAGEFYRIALQYRAAAILRKVKEYKKFMTLREARAKARKEVA